MKIPYEIEKWYREEEFKENVLGVILGLVVLFISSFITAYSLNLIISDAGWVSLAIVVPISVIGLIFATFSVLATVYFSFIIILRFWGVGL